ncbi:MAG: DUF423 domain-containing protein, partial [Thermoproteota archaeon]|nr:DUF423 domain-containing protein [Thermoproteota archaeon]
IIYAEFKNKYIKWAGWFFIAGIIFFSGSLYCLTYVKAAVLPGYQWIGVITPVGGLFFILGWVFLSIGLFNKKTIY